ncbi:class I SAM-dependent methyltransferase [Chloroflexia bacterium SDU3-3]|nr:class I SAM-dependent methyltransferase [Chloroflexia bacterium SDU3-3]
MEIEQVWQVYAAQGYPALRLIAPSTASAQLYYALIAFAHDDIAAAQQAAQAAAASQPDSRVFAEAAIYLGRVAQQGRQQVYVDGGAFTAFITSGGNVPLYVETSRLLRQIYEQHDQLRLLDVGAGNGHALIPALVPQVAHVGVVEPSAALSAELGAKLEQRGVAHTIYPSTLQDFARQHGQRWDLIQATYSLQSIPPAERGPMLRWLRQHTDRLLIAEFDAPAVRNFFEPSYVRYVLERYEQGLAEYASDHGLVSQGFLMPVMFGYFDRSALRTNYEQPIAAWADDLRAAGFGAIDAHAIYPYWWGAATLLDARA